VPGKHLYSYYTKIQHLKNHTAEVTSQGFSGHLITVSKLFLNLPFKLLNNNYIPKLTLNQIIMRKLFTMLILLFLWAGSSWAQGNYGFAYSAGTYTEITGGTVLGSATSDDQRFVDPAVPAGGTATTGVGFPIGFNFTYGGIVFNRFAVNNNGWISLGQSALTPAVNIASTSSYTPLSSTTTITPADLVARIVGLGLDQQGQTGSELRIQTIGTSPNQELVIQWKNYRGYNLTGDNLNYQIRLLEATNEIKIVYGTMTKGTSGSAQVGLRGTPAITATNFHSRTTTTNWTATTAGTNSSTCTISSTVYPNSGTTYTFTPPLPCVAPVNAATALILTPASTTVAGSFTAAAGADSYLVIRTPDGIPTVAPVNGTTYTVGAALGNATVVASGASTTFTASTLTGGTLYYFHVYSMNSFCSGGPLYLASPVLVGSTTTLPNPPASIAAAAISSTQIDLTTIANVAGNPIMIAYSLDNVFGTPTGTYNPGDPISGGGIVVNTGAAGVTNHTGLIQGTQYYYRAWSVAGGNYSSSYVSANAITLCSAPYSAPYTMAFEGLQDPAACWTEANGQLLPTTVLTGTTSNWAKDDWRNILTPVDKAEKLNIWSTALYGWLFTPQIDLGTGTYQLEFDLTLNAYGTSTAPGTTGTDDKFAVVISTDGGTTWTSANTLRLWDNAGSTYVYNNINFNGERIVISLAGYTGIIKIGFYGESTVSNADNDLMINNFAIVPPPACNIPTGFAYSAVTATTANISWVGAPTVEIDYAIGAHTAGSGTIVPNVTANPYGLTGLTPNSTYYVYVRQNCGAGNFSTWVGPISFTTACDAISIPWAENFDAVTIPAFPSCWTKENGDWVTTNNANSTYDADARSGTQFLRETYSATNEYMWTPGFALTSGVSYDFTFWWAGDTYAGWDADVFYNTSATSVGATALGAPFVSAATTTTKTYAKVVRTFVPSATGTYYFAIRVNGTSVPWYLSFDDFSVGLTPACPAVSGLTATGITGSSADLSWNANGTTAWQIEWGTNGFTPTGTPNIPVATNPYTLSGLLPLTSYSYYVRANCTAGGNGYSTWEGPYTFTTLVSCPPPTAQVVTGIAANEAYLGWTNPGGTLWNIEYGLSGFVQGTGTVISSNTNPKRISGLTSNTAYSWYVQQDCGGGTTSTWTGPNTFTTLCDPTTAPYAQPFTTALIPACWTMSGPQSWVFSTTWSDYGADALADHTAGGGTNYAGVDGSGSAGLTGITLLSQMISVTGVVNPRISFYMFNNNTNTALLADEQKLTLDIWDGDSWNTGAFVWDFGQNAAGWQQKTVSLSSYTIVGPIQLRFVVDKGTGLPFYDDMIIDDVVVEATPSCLPPTVLPVTAITQTTATISWTAPSPAPGSGYQWEVRTSGAGGSGATGLVQSGSTTAGTTSANVAGLTSATSYSVYVRSNCGAGDFSVWGGPVTFVTTCGTYAVPYTQNFDAVTTPAIPTCWTIYSSAALRPWLTQSTTQQPAIGAHSEPNFAAIFYSATAAKDEWLVSPGIQLTSGIAYRAKFFVKAPGYAGVPEKMKVTVSTDPSLVGVSAGTIIWNDANMLYSTWTEFSAPFTPSATGTYYFSWHGYSVADVDYIALDDITIEPVPTCDSPTAITASAITQTTATISWTASVSNPSLGYQYEVRTSGAGGSGATGLVASGSTAAGVVTANVTGLTAATTYTVYVRSHCSAAEYSAWGSGSFSTTCGVYNAPFEETVEVATFSPCWTVSGGTYNWGIVTGASGYGTGTRSFRANFYSIPADSTLVLFTPEVNTSTLTNPQVEFDYAYAAYDDGAGGDYVDALIVYYTTDNGATFNSLTTMLGGLAGDLNTAPATSSSFVPTAAQWATISFALPAGTDQVAFLGYSAFGNNLFLDNVKINEAPIVNKTLNLTNVLLEGLYAGGGALNYAKDDLGNPKFSTTVADMITVELHNSADYTTIEHSALVELSTSGTATVTGIPSTLGDSYYITVRHRNSIETTTASPVSFAGTTISQSFATPADVYGGNLLLMSDMGYAIFGGDVNQDGAVDGGDVTPFDNDQFNFVMGYVDSDVNGDGSVDSGDGTIIDNNQFNFVGSAHP